MKTLITSLLLVFSIYATNSVFAAHVSNYDIFVTDGARYEAMHSTDEGIFEDIYHLTYDSKLLDDLSINPEALTGTISVILPGAPKIDWLGAYDNLGNNFTLNTVYDANNIATANVLTLKITDVFNVSNFTLKGQVLHGINNTVTGFSTYSGNWTTAVTASAVPVPPAVVLFLSSLIGIKLVSRKSKS